MCRCFDRLVFDMSIFHIVMTVIGAYFIGFAVTAFVIALFNGKDEDGWTIPVTMLWPVTLPVMALVYVISFVYSLPTMLGEYLHDKLTPKE